MYAMRPRGPSILPGLLVLLILPLSTVLDAVDGPAAPDSAPPPASATAPSEQARPGERFENFFAPYKTDLAALSPDGKLLAYSLREADVVSVIVIEIDQPTVAKAKVTVVSDKQATPALAISNNERVPAQINWMRWVTPTRLALETNRVFVNVASDSSTANWTSIAGEVIAFDADGKNARTLADARRVSNLSANIPPTSPTAVDPTAFAEASGAAPESSSTGATGSAPTASGYRAPMVLGFDPANPAALLVLGHTAAGLGLYSINNTNGKMRYLEEEIFDARMVMLLDRAGKPRIGLPYRSRGRFPLDYQLETGKFGKPWRKLDEIASAAGLPAGFVIGPHNYFSHRHVPLGFGPDAGTLYFASNVGRENFGIYSINLTNNQKTGTAIENPAIDLWEPVAGTFPDPAVSWFSLGVDVEGQVDALNDAAEQAQRDLAAQEGEQDPETIRPYEAGLVSDPRARIGATITPSRNTDDGLLVFDRFDGQLCGIRIRVGRPTTQWLRPELAQVQTLLEQKFQPNAVEIREWDSAANRFLFSVSGPALPGAWYVFDRTAGTASEFAPRAPWLAALTSGTMLSFGFTSPAGVPIQGMITVPRAPRVRPIPVVIVPARMPWQSWAPVFKSEIQALADMGFAVVEFSGRGAWGRGVRLRERIREGYEDAQVEDLIATADYVTQHFAVSPSRFAVAGFDHGGHVALRALELAPTRFKCAVAVNTPVNLRTWLGELEWNGGSASVLLIEPMFGDRARQKDAPLIRDIEKIERPALLFNFRGPLGASATNSYSAAKQFATSLSRRVPTTEIVDINEDYMNRLPKARGAVFARIEEFLNANIYDYKVKTGELQVDEVK